ncbi:UxaA family hydrolase [Chelatococcus composti]|jgi:Altronate dehydratase|uniref:Altronate hydrolase n=1 Tax=Chelatococcus composti TaxID=1743235 RepID=A0A841K4A9_9HYPH|nr:altronate dehydratase family protein [Chelatococcus composti]MBB6167608.1 altronate hydrolase [Chelatococcus composti]MBS7735811.1 altronate dehydratase [Chelatococcus composti]PZN45884.1 MAG: galactonate dehydratase [Pseudomonadota bacterium]GGG33151.1 dehydratase [Chelatococcus composti]
MDRPVTPRTLRLNAADNVIVAVDALEPGTSVEGVTATQRVPRGHKLAVAPVAQGEPIIKFGQIIGFASKPIAPGEWVHEHNVEMHDFARDYRFAEAAREEEILPLEQRATFQGFRRANGKVGTRNYIGILTSVNCSATVARFMAEEIRRSGILEDYPNVDGVIPLVHGGGCALDVKGEGYEVLKRTQWGYATNPNMAAVVMVGLGCEGFQIARWKEMYGIEESDTFRSFTIQEVGGTKKTVEAGAAAIRDMLPIANRARRETVPASELVLALQCGGSDGYSGITANPALGAAADLLVRHGGTAILSETPEIYGAEHLLTRRAATREIGEKLVELIKWWEDYTARNKMEMNNNPSPGNKAGGLTTILEKSLGAAAKGGTTTMTGVYRYAEPVTAKGFVFMDTPGYDPVSATGQVAGGANILAFTTGRGSAYGCKPTPSIKLATNTEMYQRMIDDMDINCGDVLDGVSIEEKGREIFEKLLRVASGERSKSELLGYGDAEFVPWQIGATM